MHPSPIDDIPDALCRELDTFFTDIDDTLTASGLLPASSYSRLWALAGHGVKPVVVTGRPAGWCDLIARMWPVEAVIGENGAFIYAYRRRLKKMERIYMVSEGERSEGRRRLEAVRRRALSEVPGCAVAADQAFRLSDLAIDFREDVPALSRRQVDRICRIAAEEGATCKVSSIHVNCWYGDFDKVAGLRAYLKNRSLSLDDPGLQERILFIGDSPNDEPMFKHLRHTVAVANIREFLDQLVHPPRYLTAKPAADGFCEAVDLILKKRTKKQAGGG
jgi:HAD superfamily hydrolase (TIGR01484 family)